MTENALTIVPQSQQSQVNLFDPDTVMKFMPIAAEFHKSGLFPHIKTPAAAFAIINFGLAIGIAPYVALNQINIIAGKPTSSAQLMLALASSRGVTWKIIEETDKRCIIDFEKGKSKYRSEFTWEDAVKLGLTERDQWKKQPKTMMLWRTVSKGLRVIDPAALMGLYTTDEIEESPKIGVEQAINITPPKQDEPFTPEDPKNELCTFLTSLVFGGKRSKEYFDDMRVELGEKKFGAMQHFFNSHCRFVDEEMKSDYGQAIADLKQDHTKYAACYKEWLTKRIAEHKAKQATKEPKPEPDTSGDSFDALFTFVKIKRKEFENIAKMKLPDNELALMIKTIYDENNNGDYSFIPDTEEEWDVLMKQFAKKYQG